MKTRIYVIGLCAFALLIASTAVTMSSTANDGKGARALEGSWQVRLTPTSGSPPFDEYMTFTSGGGIIESNNFPFYQSGLTAGPGHGTWQHNGEHQFAFAFRKFLFTPAGQSVGTLKAAGVLTYSTSTDSWSGPANVSICDNFGENCNLIDVTNGDAVRMPTL